MRVIDLITNMDMAAFQALGGLQAFINRLEVYSLYVSSHILFLKSHWSLSIINQLNNDWNLNLQMICMDE